MRDGDVAYGVKGVPEWVYGLERVDLRTWFPEWGEMWRPWEEEGDAWGAVESLRERGWEVGVRSWSGKSPYCRLAGAIQAAVRRYGLAHEAGKRVDLWGVRVGREGGWVIAPTLQEAVCRCVLALITKGQLKK